MSPKPSMSAAFTWRVMLRRKQWTDRLNRLLNEPHIDDEKVHHARNMVMSYERVLADQGQWMVHELESWLKAATEYREDSP